MYSPEKDYETFFLITDKHVTIRLAETKNQFESKRPLRGVSEGVI